MVDFEEVEEIYHTINSSDESIRDKTSGSRCASEKCFGITTMRVLAGSG